MDRIPAIDFTKGILVIFMVLYHSLNYYGVFPHRYMAFLPASFIMITGFIIMQHYFPKYALDIKGIRTRLAVRSLKLVFIFTFLNLVALMIWPRYYHGITFGLEDFWGEWVAIYLVGSPQMVAFDILLPISYTLLLSLFILRLQSVTPCFIKLSAIITFGVCILMENYGTSIYNLSLISSGVIGMAIGLLPLTLINKFSRSWTKLSLLSVLSLCFVFLVGDNYYTQIFSTIIILLIIYAIGVRAQLKDCFSKQIVLLGQYSLLGYITQIVFLKMFLIGIANSNIDKPNIILTAATIMSIMWVTVLIVDHARLKYRFINLLYKVVFA